MPHLLILFFLLEAEDFYVKGIDTGYWKEGKTEPVPQFFPVTVYTPDDRCGTIVLLSLQERTKTTSTV